MTGLNPWQGIHVDIFNDTSDELCVEGARMSAKTTLLADKEIAALQKHPGIKTLIFRYSDTATKTLLAPRFEEVCALRGLMRDQHYRWDARELCYEFENSSKVYAFGLKAADQQARYQKLRGLDVSRVWNDQAEETPADIGQELRASLRQKGYPHQLTFSPNPVNTNFWLADPRHGGFPLDNSVKGRHYYSLSIYDNAYNLDPADIQRWERTYPPDHAKHGAMVLGKRGFNVVGDAVFEDTFKRSQHVRSVWIDASQPLLEAFEFGKHNPAWVVAQRCFEGGLIFHGGIIGEGMFLEDFLPQIREYRRQWFERPPLQLKTCCPPPGNMLATNGSRFTNYTILRQDGFRPVFRETANSADVQLALIEQLAGYMRRDQADGEADTFAVNSDEQKWLKVSRQGIEPWPFLAQAFEAGVVWDEHFRSVGNNPVRQVKNDDWFANALHCAQNIELNFCADRLTASEREIRARRQHQARRVEGSRVAVNPDAWML